MRVLRHAKSPSIVKLRTKRLLRLSTAPCTRGLPSALQRSELPEERAPGGKHTALDRPPEALEEPRREPPPLGAVHAGVLPEALGYAGQTFFFLGPDAVLRTCIGLADLRRHVTGMPEKP